MSLGIDYCGKEARISDGKRLLCVVLIKGCEICFNLSVFYFS